MASVFLEKLRWMLIATCTLEQTMKWLTMAEALSNICIKSSDGCHTFLMMSLAKNQTLSGKFTVGFLTACDGFTSRLKKICFTKDQE
jgi:hypothetical protein